MSTNALVIDAVLIFQPSLIHIEIASEGIWLLCYAQKLNQLRCGACPLSVQYDVKLFQNGVRRNLVNLRFDVIQILDQMLPVSLEKDFLLALVTAYDIQCGIKGAASLLLQQERAVSAAQ